MMSMSVSEVGAGVPPVIVGDVSATFEELEVFDRLLRGMLFVIVFVVTLA